MRRFKDTPVSREVVERLIEFANWAPSNCNIQGWRFVVIDEVRLKQAIIEHGGSAVIKAAPLGILVCYDNRSDNLEYNDWLQSAAAAVENILLGAHTLGLGGCWICHLPTPRVLRKLFKIPAHYTPVAYLAIGYALGEPKAVPRRRMAAELYDYNRFPRSDKTDEGYRFLILRRLARRCYYALPVFVKRKIAPFINRHFVKQFDN